MVEITEGWCKAGLFHANLEYIKKKRGGEGLHRLDKKLGELGISLTQIRTMRTHDHVPLSVRAKFLDACLDVFDGNLERIKEMGREAPRVSSLIKMILPYFLTINYTLKHAPGLWKEHYSVGELVVLENEPDHARLALKNFRSTRLMCVYFTGYFVGVGDLCKAKNMVCTEVKCVHDGDDWCEYAFKWDV
ncbi:MAG: hypothetical protein N3F63_04450 [Thermoplasmata archaeon]|nr:hypothetical protein [Thermoplasmata archaeon]